MLENKQDGAGDPIGSGSTAEMQGDNSIDSIDSSLVASCFVTVVTANRPRNKSYELVEGFDADDSPQIVKNTPHYGGVQNAETVSVKNLADFGKLLDKVGNEPNQFIINGYCNGTEAGQKFNILSRSAIANKQNIKEDKVKGLYHGKKSKGDYCARLKNTFKPSNIVLFDRDEVEGMPSDLIHPDVTAWWARMIEAYPMLKGVAHLIVKSNSGRILQDGEYAYPNNEHIYTWAKNADDIERFGKVALIHAFSRGVGFRREGNNHPWSMFDPTVFVSGREVYEGCPTVKGKGLAVEKANAVLIQGGLLDTETLRNPSKVEQDKAGMKLGKSKHGASYTITDSSCLTLDTVIELEDGVSKRLRDIVAYMVEEGIDKVRCQTPFRPESTSMNGIIRFTNSGEPCFHDNGSTITYLLRHLSKDMFKDQIEGKLEPPVLQTERKIDNLREGITDDQIDEILGELNDEDNPVTVERCLKALQPKVKATLKALKERMEQLAPVAFVDFPCPVLKEFALNHGVVAMAGKVSIVYLSYNDADGIYQYEFLKKQDFELLHADKFVSDRTGKIRPIASVFLTEKEVRMTYTSVKFLPVRGLVAEKVVLPLPDEFGCLNLYRGTAYEPVTGDCQLIIQHVWEVWCNHHKGLFNYVMCWLARMVQYPDKLGETALLLQSGEGTGKNAIVDIFSDYFGAYAYVATKQDDITGQFTARMKRSCFVFFNEATFGGDKSGWRVLKYTVTDEIAYSEEKFQPTIKHRNFCSLIVASNNDFAVPMGLDDRRFVVIGVSEKYKGDAVYFTALHACIANGGDSAFIYYLMNMDIKGFNPRTLPDGQSDRKADQKRETMGSVNDWYFNLLKDGIQPQMSLVSSFPVSKDDVPWVASFKVSSQVMHEDYLYRCNKQKIKRPKSRDQMMKELKKVADVKTVRTQQGKLKNFLSLNDSRVLYDEKMGGQTNWDD